MNELDYEKAEGKDEGRKMAYLFEPRPDMPDLPLQSENRYLRLPKRMHPHTPESGSSYASIVNLD